MGLRSSNFTFSDCLCLSMDLCIGVSSTSAFGGDGGSTRLEDKEEDDDDDEDDEGEDEEVVGDTFRVLV